MKIDKTPEALKWLKYAEDDLKSAKVLNKEELYAQVCFHAQQCAEKSLKAYLTKEDQRIPKIHILRDIIDLCKKIDCRIFNQFDDDVLTLDRYYIPTRYPDAVLGSLPEGLPEKVDATEAIEIAERMFGFVGEKVGG